MILSLPRRNFPVNRQSLLLFLTGPAFMGALSLLAWLLLGGGVIRAPQRIEFVIPEGAAARVRAGEAVPSIPAKAVFVAGDVLALRNDDTANHQVGPFWIPAKTTITVPLERASTFKYLCTIHPSGYIGLEVRPRDSLRLTVIPTLGLGLPMGAALVIIARVMARL
jgi:hypothetical protein